MHPLAITHMKINITCFTLIHACPLKGKNQNVFPLSSLGGCRKTWWLQSGAGSGIGKYMGIFSLIIQSFQLLWILADVLSLLQNPALHINPHHLVSFFSSWSDFSGLLDPESGDYPTYSGHNFDIGKKDPSSKQIGRRTQCWIIMWLWLQVSKNKCLEVLSIILILFALAVKFPGQAFKIFPSSEE